jgi:hypothetical protein
MALGMCCLEATGYLLLYRAVMYPDSKTTNTMCLVHSCCFFQCLGLFAA